MNQNWLVSAFLVLTLGHAWCSAKAQSAIYTVTDLGTLGGATSTACGINDLSQVVGKSTIATGQLHAFLWQNGIIIDLGTLPGLSFSEARAVNNRGQAVGDSSAAGGPPFHAVLFENGEVIPLGTLPGGFASFAIGINDRGQIVGASRTAIRDVHAFLWQKGEIEDLGTLLASDHQGVARVLNSRDQVVGNSSAVIGDPPAPPNRAFLWQDGGFTDLGTLGGNWAIAFGMNERGQIVGGSFLATGELRAFLWQDGVMTDLGTLGGTSSVAQSRFPASCNLQPDLGTLGTFSLANGINNRGQIVGRSIAANGEDHAFVWFGDLMTDLNSVIPGGSGWTLIEATSINSSGQIVGFGTINGQTHAFVLTPNEN